MRPYSLSSEVPEEEKYKNRTYAMREERISGHTDGIESVRQAVYKILNTERFEYPVYSFYYGINLSGLVGKEQPYVRAELKRLITDALKQDDRIQEVSNFLFVFEGDSCRAEFTVKSVLGEVDGKVKVSL